MVAGYPARAEAASLDGEIHRLGRWGEPGPSRRHGADQTGEEGQEGKEGEPEPSATEAEDENAEGRQQAELASDAQADQDSVTDETLDEREEGAADRLDRESDMPDALRRPEPPGRSPG